MAGPQIEIKENLKQLYVSLGVGIAVPFKIFFGSQGFGGRGSQKSLIKF